MPSTNHPYSRSATEPLSWALRHRPPRPASDVIFEGRTTTTPDGREEYTALLPDLPPEEKMTHWLTVDSAAVVSLSDWR